MKNLLYILLLIACFGCSSESAWDCVQTSGTIVRQAVEADFFHKIQIENEVELILRQGSEASITIETGENLLSAVSVSVVDETLIIVNTNTCNLVRDYAPVRAYVTVSNLTQIRNSSIYPVRSEGILAFESLRLLSNTSGTASIARKSGDFYLQLDNEELIISANGRSVFYLDGNVRRGRFVFTDEFPRLEAANLLVDTLQIQQRSANKMIINPQRELRGVIQGVGDVVSHNRPEVVEVEELYTGRLIFLD